MHSFLLYTNNMDTFDAVAVKRGYASFEDIPEEDTELKIPYPLLVGGINVPGFEHTFTFKASTIKGWTLPQDVPITGKSVVFNPGHANAKVESETFYFTVESIQASASGREKWLGVTVNGVEYPVRDTGGKQRVDAEGTRIYDFGAQGWPLLNKAAVYDGTTQLQAPEKLPGSIIVMTLYDQKYEDDLLDVSEVKDPTVFDKSKLAQAFKKSGTERTYSKTDKDTDWGKGYDLTYYELDFGGDVIAMIDPNTVPDELISQHGILKRLTR